MVPSVATEKFPNVVPPGIDSETVRLVAQCLNHNFTPGPDKYRGIHNSVKYFKNSQQIEYATDHGNSYADRERNCLSYFMERADLPLRDRSTKYGVK
jgi:hypothetical protein